MIWFDLRHADLGPPRHVGDHRSLDYEMKRQRVLGALGLLRRWDGRTWGWGHARHSDNSVVWGWFGNGNFLGGDDALSDRYQDFELCWRRAIGRAVA